MSLISSFSLESLASHVPLDFKMRVVIKYELCCVFASSHEAMQTELGPFAKQEDEWWGSGLQNCVTGRSLEKLSQA